MCRELHVHQYDGTCGVRSTEEWIEGVSTNGKQKVARILEVATLVQLFVLCTICKAHTKADEQLHQQFHKQHHEYSALHLVEVLGSAILGMGAKVHL